MIKYGVKCEQAQVSNKWKADYKTYNMLFSGVLNWEGWQIS